jgi:hypothetical protein
MTCNPPNAESLAGLRRLREEVSQRGDDCLAMLLGGVYMYVSIGREWELLEVMRKFAHDSEEMVRGTPSAEELQKLYERPETELPGASD